MTEDAAGLDEGGNRLTAGSATRRAASPPGRNIGAAPAVLRGVHATGRLSAGALFVASYLAVWALVGVAVYPLYRPHGTLVAGSLAIAAGIYELTPLKRLLPPALSRGHALWAPVRALVRRLEHRTDADVHGAGCHEHHLDVRDRHHRPRPEATAPKATIDVSVGLAITGLGILIVIAPSLVPRPQPM